MAWQDDDPQENKNKEKKIDKWQSSNQQEGPPDLEEALKKMQASIVKLFGGGNAGRNHHSGGNMSGSNGIGLAAVLLFLLIVILWVLSGILIVRPSEKAVILRFGAYHQTFDPGPHWIPRIIDTVQKVNVTKVHSYDYQDQMLNKDENIVYVSMSVFYRIQNPGDYLFNVVNPSVTLKQATASALRQVVGHTTLDDVMTIGREKVGEDVQQLLKDILVQYQTGLEVTEVNIQEVKAPVQVQEAFDDAIKAREDEQRYIEKAQAYAAGVFPIAEGNAQRILEEANAEKAKIILKAEGEVARFNKLLPIYQKAPQITHKRLHIEALEDVFSHTTKIVLDGKGNNQMIYLPLDQLLKRSEGKDIDPVEIIQNESIPQKHTEFSEQKQFSSRQLGRNAYHRPARSH